MGIFGVPALQVIQQHTADQQYAPGNNMQVHNLLPLHLLNI